MQLRWIIAETGSSQILIGPHSGVGHPKMPHPPCVRNIFCNANLNRSPSTAVRIVKTIRP